MSNKWVGDRFVRDAARRAALKRDPLCPIVRKAAQRCHAEEEGTAAASAVDKVGSSIKLVQLARPHLSVGRERCWCGLDAAAADAAAADAAAAGAVLLMSRLLLSSLPLLILLSTACAAVGAVHCRRCRCTNAGGN